MAKMKILVADDEQPIRSYIAKKLVKLGYTVFTAEDGEQALQQSFARLPDVILLDVKMPLINGIEVCKRIKADLRTRNIRIIMLSAKAQTKEIEEGLAAGADRYLCKPIGFPDILREIRAGAEDCGEEQETAECK